MQTHVVIGGCGFTGSHLIRKLLPTSASIMVIDTGELPKELVGKVVHHRVDIRDRAALDGVPLASDAIVYHLAARQFHGDIPKRNQDAWFADVNVRGTAEVLRWASREQPPRLIYLSTDMVYGIPDAIPVSTRHPKRPLGPYGRSKAEAEALCEQARCDGAQVTILRPRMIVGPGRFGILTRLFRLMDMGLPVPTIGSGNNRYQMIAVEDVVDAILLAVAKGFPGQAFNLGSGDAPPVRRLLQNTIRRIGSRSTVVPVPAAPLKWLLGALDRCGLTLLHREQYRIADLQYMVDISDSRDVLGWRPDRNDEDMLVDAYNHYREELESASRP